MEKSKEFKVSWGDYNRLWYWVVDEFLANFGVIIDACRYGEISWVRFRCSYRET